MESLEVKSVLDYLTVRGVVEKQGNLYTFTSKFWTLFHRWFEICGREDSSAILALSEIVYPDYFTEDEAVVVYSLLEALKRKLLKKKETMKNE